MGDEAEGRTGPGLLGPLLGRCSGDLVGALGASCSGCSLSGGVGAHLVRLPGEHPALSVRRS